MANKLEKNNFHKKAKLKLLLIILLVNSAVILTHWPSLSSQVLLFDDDQYMTGNVLVQNPSLTSAKRFLIEIFRPSTVEGYYQPLTMISLMSDYALGGRPDNLKPFHCTSLILHALNTTLLLLLLYLLFKSIWAATVSALLFGLHPMTIESICWIAERKTLLATFFALSSLIFYVKFVRKPKLIFYAFCFAFYFLAVLSKPTALPLPVLMILMDFWPLKRLNPKAFLEKIPFLPVMAVFAFITYISQQNTAAVTNPAHYGIKHILLVLCHNIIFYPYKMIWPVKLSSHYPFLNPMSLSCPMVLAGLIGTCILIPLLAISLKYTKALATGWLFFFIAIFPTMGVVGFTNVIASHKFAYLPAVGLLMTLTYFLTKIQLRKYLGNLVPLISIAVFLFCTAESIASRKHLKLWNNSIGYYKHMIEMAPDSIPLHNSIGCIFMDAGKFDESKAHFEKVLKLNPDYYRAHYNLAMVFKEKGDLNKALHHCNETLKIFPAHSSTYNLLGLIAKSQGDLDQAILYFQQAMKIDPSMYAAYSNLGISFAIQQKFDQALSCFKQSLEINPNYHEARFNLATALKEMGKLDQSIAQFARLLQVQPDNPETYFSLGTIFQLQGRDDQAIQLYSKAIEIKPDHFTAHNNLASIYIMSGNFDLAKWHFQKAINLKPDYSTALNGLSRILATHPETPKRNPQQAVDLAKQAAGLTGYQNIQVLETLFIAYSSAGKVDEARNTLQKMLQLSSKINNVEWTNYIKEQLQNFETK